MNVTGIFASGGAQAVERYLSLENLSNRNATDALLAIADFVCPDGGPQDEGIARNAYITAIEESPEIASIPFEELTAEQMLLIVQKSMANVVCGRILNDIGVAERLVAQIKEFVKGAISDAVSDLKVDVNNLSQHQSIDIVNEVYQTTFEIMARVGDDE